MEKILKNKWTWIILGVIILLFLATKRYSNKSVNNALGRISRQQKFEMGGMISKAMTEFRQVNKRLASKLT